MVESSARQCIQREGRLPIDGRAAKMIISLGCRPAV